MIDAKHQALALIQLAVIILIFLLSYFDIEDLQLHAYGLNLSKNQTLTMYELASTHITPVFLKHKKSS